jgi:hypothetical protein
VRVAGTPTEAQIKKEQIEIVTTVLGIARNLKIARPTPASLEAWDRVEEALKESLTRETAPAGA